MSGIRTNGNPVYVRRSRRRKHVSARRQNLPEVIDLALPPASPAPLSTHDLWLLGCFGAAGGVLVMAVLLRLATALFGTSTPQLVHDTEPLVLAAGAVLGALVGLSSPPAAPQEPHQSYDQDEPDQR